MLNHIWHFSKRENKHFCRIKSIKWEPLLWFYTTFQLQEIFIKFKLRLFVVVALSIAVAMESYDNRASG